LLLENNSEQVIEREEQAEKPVQILPQKRISRHNTRLPSDFQVKM